MGVRAHFFQAIPLNLELRRMILGGRDRGRRIQIAGHSDSDNPNTFGASSNFTRMSERTESLASCVS